MTLSEDTKILVIEDEVPIRRFLKASLEKVAWVEAETGQEGLRLAAQRNPDLILLDLGLPDIDGLEVLKSLREWSNVPVIVLSARGKEKDKILALDGGADDYLTKPFAVGELMARIRVALRHSGKSPEGEEATFEHLDLVVDFASRSVRLKGVQIHLTQIEYKLLGILIHHAGKVVTQRHLLMEVWGPAYLDSTHTLRVHMANLRQKIEQNTAYPDYIATEIGVGYRFLVKE